MLDLTSGWIKSPSYCILIALGAAVLGSIAGATLFLAAEALEASNTVDAFAVLIPAILVMSVVAMIVALPCSLIVGAPLLWLSQGLVRRWPIATTIVLGLIGIALAIPLHDTLDSRSVHRDQYLSAMVVFGATVAAAHSVLLFHRWRQSWLRTLLTILAAGLVLTGAGRTTLDWIEAAQARAQYAAECRAGSGIYLPAAGRTPAMQVQAQTATIGATVSRGSWHSERQSALLRNYAALFVDGRRDLVINDVAVAPVTPWSRLTGTRSIERHCLATQRDPDARRARAAGLVSSPPTAWPNDRIWW